jgi:hypothetical protein
VSYRVLSEEQVEQFIERGHVRLEEAFPREQALAAQDLLWERLAERNGVRRDDPATWTEPMVHLKEVYTDPVFQACQTERLSDAVEDLVGRRRWAGRGKPAQWGWWPVNFAVGSDRPWDVPTGGWHWDGQQFRHSVTAHQQGLLLLPHFSSVGPRGGGTLVADGSHHVVARLLAQYPDGVEQPVALDRCRREHPWLAELTGVTTTPEITENRVAYFMDRAMTDAHGTTLRVSETLAEPGDVILCHPFLYHAASQNHSGVPRFMCNRTTPLAAQMNLSRPDGDHSSVEIAIRHALGAAA